MIKKNMLGALTAVTAALLFVGCQPAVPDEHYTDNGDGTVTDEQTNLIWQRCSLGQTWTGKTCDGEPVRVTWEQAVELEQDGWRLPTVDELYSLVHCTGERRESIRPDGQYVEATDGQCLGDFQQPTINKRVFPGTSKIWFWSSSPYEGLDGYLWFVHFGSGHVGRGDDYYAMHVRFVRDGE